MPIFPLNRDNWMASAAYAQNFGAQWHSLIAPSPALPPPAKSYGTRKINLREKLDPFFPEQGVLTLNEAELHGEHAWIVSKEGLFLPDHSWFRGHDNEIDEVVISRATGALPGTGLLLASDWSATNFGHFLLDALPRLHLFLSAGYSLDELDYICCGFPSPHACAIARALGISVDRCLRPVQRLTFSFERLIAPTFPGGRRNPPKWAVEFLRSRVTPKLTRGKRRLYLPRTTTRKIANETTIIEFLTEHDFKVVDPARDTNPIATFAAADFVISSHSAALANIVFCRPGTKILEIMPSDHVYPYYYALSASADLDYHYLVAASTQERAADAKGPSPHGVVVDMDEFHAAVSALLG